MKAILKAVLPRMIKDRLIRHMALSHAHEENDRLEKIVVGLKNKHINALKVLPSRQALLENLPKEAVVAEVGVADGEFSQLILDTCRPRTLHLIDYWGSSISAFGDAGYQRVMNRFEEQISDHQVVVHRGLSWEMLRKFPDQGLDWVYLDAGHGYDSVKKDLLAVKPKMKPDGIICGHDYVKWSSQVGRFGVVEAVNEFCNEYDFEMIFLTIQKNMHLSYAIRHDPNMSP